MPVIQTFDTFLADSGTGASLMVQTLPSASLVEQLERPDRDILAVAEILGFQIVGQVFLAASGLPRILARMLAAPQIYAEFGREPSDAWWQNALVEQPDLATFVEEVSFRPLIPSEMSPFELRSLGDIATGSVVVLGLLEGNPVLVLSGLAGVIVVRAVSGLARGVERAFEEAGYEWTHRLLRLRRRSHE